VQVPGFTALWGVGEPRHLAGVSGAGRRAPRVRYRRRRRGSEPEWV